MLATKTDQPNTFELHDGERLTVVSHTPECLRVEGEWAPGGPAPLPHLHPHQDERFTVLEGRLDVEIGGARRVLCAGDVLDIPRGTSHRMHNAGDVPAKATWETMPAG